MITEIKDLKYAYGVPIDEWLSKSIAERANIYGKHMSCCEDDSVMSAEREKYTHLYYRIAKEQEAADALTVDARIAEETDQLREQLVEAQKETMRHITKGIQLEHELDKLI